MWWFVAITCLIHATVNSEEQSRSGKYGNPEVHLNVSEVISFHGYASEEYEVLTDDGYYLTMNRIPCGRKNHTTGGPRPVVLLQHGLLAEASFWVENMDDNSFGFILADAGFDVWLGNSRGSSWSQRHQNLSLEQEEFWDFSFHEMAMYDLPAMINFILQKTQQEQLYYVGYSQGATIGFIAFSAMPELSQKVKTFFALAPVVSLKHAASPMVKLSLSLSGKCVKGLLNARYEGSWDKKFIVRLCSYPLMTKICAHILFSTGGFNATNLNMSRIDVYVARYPDATSNKNLLHWQQVGYSGLFRWFDYGSENQAKYNQSSPPLYKIEDMMVPTAVWSGGNDLMADPEDIKVLIPQIRKLVYHHTVSDWNHWDFVWGLNAPQRMFFKIITFIRNSL